MENIPNHTLPPCSQEALEDALFHYTTADGLMGIFQNNELWNTAYYCMNDESELVTGKGILTPLFTEKSHDLVVKNDQRIMTLRQRGVDVRDLTEKFESLVIDLALSSLSAYITCFCKPRREEDFHHGLLSQWRGYGSDGGYALQFNRSKLQCAVNATNEANKLNYELQDVHYDKNNLLKGAVLEKKDAFVNAYLIHLDLITKPLSELFNSKSMPNPISQLLGGPLGSLLDYLIQTKNQHFSEENECRLSLIQTTQPCDSSLPVSYFNRNGLLVPYTKTPRNTLDILDCIEWIVIGPGPRIKSRMNSVRQLVQQSGKDIKVRPSHIPFSRA